MVKKSSQKLKTNKSKIPTNNENKDNDTTVGASNYATYNAITLIALVITIIVLLILAGVTINLVLGPEGLLKQAQDATDKYKQAENEELNSMSNLLAQLEAINNGNGEETGTPSKPDNPQKPSIPAGEITKTENNINYVSDGEGNEIPVPVGFTYAEEGTKETGFVIRNDKDLNEFVWIPVKDMPYVYNRYAFSGGDVNNLEIGIDTETNSTKIQYNSNNPFYSIESLPADEQVSVEFFGGYYIARYEAGILTKRTNANVTPTKSPIFRKSEDTVVYVYNYIHPAQAKTLSEGLYNKSENNVKSKLCSSYAWDTALKFVETKNPGWVTNSLGSNYPLEFGGSGGLAPTGYHCVNNIFDLGRKCC